MPETNESGGALRERLEAESAEKNAWREALAKNLGVDSDDFPKGMNPDEALDQAAAIREKRQNAAYELLAKEQGITVEEVKAKFAANEPDEGQRKHRPDTVASLGSAGRPPADLGREARDPNASGLDRVMQFHRTARKS